MRNETMTDLAKQRVKMHVETFLSRQLECDVRDIDVRKKIEELRSETIKPDEKYEINMNSALFLVACKDVIRSVPVTKTQELMHIQAELKLTNFILGVREIEVIHYCNESCEAQLIFKMYLQDPEMKFTGLTKEQEEELAVFAGTEENFYIKMKIKICDEKQGGDIISKDDLHKEYVWQDITWINDPKVAGIELTIIEAEAIAPPLAAWISKKEDEGQTEMFFQNYMLTAAAEMDDEYYSTLEKYKQ